MGNTSGVAYNPNDPLQAGFLAALEQGETGGAANASTLGTGGVNLASIISSGNVDKYGFPNWSGTGNSHAAGNYQFQPATWDSIASEYNLNFSTPGDQAQGAWYLAEQVYQQKTGGDLETALQQGNYSSIQSALATTWTSVTGNASLPQGLAKYLGGSIAAGQTAVANQTTANNQSGGTAAPGSSSGTSSTASGSSSGGVLSSLFENFSGSFTQIALIVLGAVVIFVALWMLLSSQGVVPSPSETVKSTGKII